MNKIFCVGLNKTGTSSLHKAFQILGYKSVHYTDDNGNNIKEIILDNYLNDRDILFGLQKYDAFSDWDKAPYTIKIFKEFDRQYPNSKFILNTRDIEDWIKSRERHVLRNRKNKLLNPKKEIRWLDINKKKWRNQFIEHHEAVKEYFKDRPDDIIEFDVTNADKWEKLCRFLSVKVPNQPFPVDNKKRKINSSLKKSIINTLFKLRYGS